MNHRLVNSLEESVIRAISNQITNYSCDFERIKSKLVDYKKDDSEKSTKIFKELKKK